MGMRRRSADAARNRSNGSRCGHSIVPAMRQSAASSDAAMPRWLASSAGNRSTYRVISGHLPRRAFCAISKNEIALTRIVWASIISARARSEMRRSLVRDHAQTRVSSRSVVSRAPPKPPARPHPWGKKVRTGAERVAFQYAQLELALGDRYQANDRFVAFRNHHIFARQRCLDQLGELRLGHVNGYFLHGVVPRLS